MAFGRSAAYVARRLGREFLIWGGVVLVVYVAVDQILYHRYQQALASWAETYAVLHPKAPVSPEPCIALEDLGEIFESLEAASGKSLHSRNIEGEISRLVFKIMHMDKQRDVLDFRGTKIAANSTDSPLVELAHDAGPTLQAAADCITFSWPKADVHIATSNAVQIQSLLRFQLAAALYFAAEGNDRACADLLVQVGRLIPKLQIPGTNIGYLYQRDLRTRMMAVTHYALANDRLTPSDVEALLAIFSVMDAAKINPLLSFVPDAMGLDSAYLPPPLGRPLLKRLLRPWLAVQYLWVLDRVRDLANAVNADGLEDRVAAYETLARRAPPMFARPEVGVEIYLNLLNQYEVSQVELEMLMLMLGNEHYRNQHGRYADALATLTEFLSPVYGVARFADSDIAYNLIADNTGYELERHLFGVATDGLSIRVDPKLYRRTWLRRTTQGE